MFSMYVTMLSAKKECHFFTFNLIYFSCFVVLLGNFSIILNMSRE